MQGKRLLFSIIHDITERKLLEKQVLEISEQERQRVGQDLHDSLVGQLAGAALIGKTLARQLKASSLPEAHLANELVHCVNASIRQTRAIARGLCPVELGAGGLSAALAELAAETQQKSGVVCSFEEDGQSLFQDLFVATHLFQIAREAINNALQHARPRHVRIQLTHGPQRGCLEVYDDGKGLPGNSPPGKGLGLRTMKYRAATIGGQLEVRSGEDGTVIRCQFLAHTDIPNQPKIAG
jgi:two-component system CheB/CheR fusion protein